MTIESDLSRSIQDEMQAASDYRSRAVGTDAETAALYEHIAQEEDTHQREFQERLAKLSEVKTMGYAVKFYDEEQGIIEGLGIPYGGTVRKDVKDLGRDLTGEYFSEKTDFKSAYFDGQKIIQPIKSLYHHGLDDTIKDMPIGEVIAVNETPEGRWMRVQLDKANKYYESIKRLVKAGKLLFSSGADPDNIKKAPDGFIEKWPLIEESLTFAPANPLAACSFKALISEIEDKEAMKMDPKDSVKSELPAVEIKPDPAVSAETNGHAPGEQKAAPAECAKKSIKCVHCGKAVELPQPVIEALNALIESAQSIVSQSAPAEAPAVPADAPVADQAAAPSQPGVSQGMTPEAPAKAVETPAAEAKETPAHEAAETPVQEKEEHNAMKAVIVGFEDRLSKAVKEAETLRERIAVLESEPANGGPARRAIKSNENPKMGNTQQEAIKSKMAVIETQLSDPNLNPQERMKLSRDKALLEIPGFAGTV